jgi:RNA polymerase sigma-70 factor (ECF subfamily)
MARPMLRENTEWVAALGGGGEAREAALADLRETLVAGLRRGLTAWLEAGSPQLEALAQDATQEALLRILERIESFEGRSRFTTWAYKVAIRIALTELRRNQWKDVSLDEMLEPKGDEEHGMSVVDPLAGPEASVEQQDSLVRIGRILQEELTPRQMAMMKAVAWQGIPMEALAQKMGVERNALYKMMHDARLKLKRRMAREGLDLGELMAGFEVRNTSGMRVVNRQGG